MVRGSLGLYNTREDVDGLVTMLKRLRQETIAAATSRCRRWVSTGRLATRIRCRATFRCLPERQPLVLWCAGAGSRAVRPATLRFGRGGGTGRRSGLKIPSSSEGPGSMPGPGTT